MKVVIAIDSFKGSASSHELAHAVSNGVRKIFPSCDMVVCPVADGGEGTVEALSVSEGARLIELTCKGPLEDLVKAKYTILKNNVAVIEMASASGLPLIPKEKRNPLITTTYGTGELIIDAIKRGVRDFIVGIGGSATNDAGTGMLRALGFRFLDSLGEEIIYAKDLNKIASIDKSQVLDELKECHFKIACDVNNPLYGPNGAAYIYAKQKGANEAMIERLDENLKVFASFVDDDLARVQGTGAAGGLGFGFLAFLNARLESGIKIILEEIQFKKKIAGTDFVITGEGKVDNQSFMGKVLDGVGQVCKEQDIPCIILCGSCKDIASDAYAKGITCVFSTLDAPMHLDEAMEKSRTLYLIEKKSEQIFRLIKQCRK